MFRICASLGGIIIVIVREYKCKKGGTVYECNGKYYPFGVRRAKDVIAIAGGADRFVGLDERDAARYKLEFVKEHKVEAVE